MKKIEIYAGVTGDGRLLQGALDQMAAALSAHRSKDIRITIDRKRKTRTCKQNRFIHGPYLTSYTAMHNELGTFDMEVDEEFAKEHLKMCFGPKQCGVPLPSRKWTTTQCETVMENARIHYASVWPLPYPNEGLAPKQRSE